MFWYNVYGMLKTILLIEDDLNLQKYLVDLLKENDYAVKAVSDGPEALNYIGRTPPDLVILDLGLPNMSGDTVLSEIRKKYAKLPILILTGKDSVQDVVKGLNLGADDYMTKPFIAEELLARIKARLRTAGGGESILEIDNLVLNNKTMEVTRDGKQIVLTPHEYKLLEYLLLNKNRVLSRDMILNRVWAYTPDIETRVVDVFIGYLRKKIDKEAKNKLIHSVRGFGYMIKN